MVTHLVSWERGGAGVGQSGVVFDVEIRLHAVSERVPVDELRAHYKANETPMLDAILLRSPSIVLGDTEVVYPGNESRRGPVGRVDALLNLRGTAEWPPEELPVLDARLQDELLAAFEIQPEDPPFEHVSQTELRSFFAAHRHAGLATTSREMPTTTG